MILRKNQIIIFFITMLTYVACSDDPTSAPIAENRLETMSEIDKMSLNSSEIVFADSIRKDVYAINFDKTDTFIEGKSFDVLIRYGTSSSCDQDLFIFNNKTSHWDQLGFWPDVVVCLGVITTQRHLLSTISLPIDNFINSEGKVLVKYSTGYFTISGRIFKVSEDYF